MMDYLLMVLFLFFIAIILLLGISEDDSKDHFFDVYNSKAMRGFWCLIVILVHVPGTFQNRIQELVGSFAYIGVTFFFMTSGYGLTISSEKTSLEHFWRKRLPKLLIPGWLVNICVALICFFALSNEIKLLKILYINDWVKWLLGCYFILWLSIKISKSKVWKIITSVIIISVSLLFYLLKMSNVVSFPTWSVECYGFIWGILLASISSCFIDFFDNKWFKKWAFSLSSALVLGVAYLRYKQVLFVGDYLLRIILGVSITLLILVTNVRFRLGNKISMFLGEISYEVYLIHSSVYYIVSKMYPELSSGVFILLCFIITVIMAYLIHLISAYIIKQLFKCELLYGKELL